MQHRRKPLEFLSARCDVDLYLVEAEQFVAAFLPFADFGEDSHVADGFLRYARRFRFERNGGVERLADDRISERVYIDECRANLCPLDNSFLLAGFVQPPQFRDGAVALHQRLVARLLCVARGFGPPFADEQIPIGLDRLGRYRISQLPFDLCGDLTKRHPPFEAQM